MRVAIFALATVIGATAAEARQVEVLSASPGRIQVAASCWTGGSYCQQDASDVAQGYCHGKFESSPRRAVYVRSENVDASFGTDRVMFIFRCDRRAITCQAGNC